MTAARSQRHLREIQGVDSAGYTYDEMEGGNKPTVQLSYSYVYENTSIGIVIGVLSVSNPVGSYTFSKIADPQNKFMVTGNQLRVAAALDYETAIFHNVTIEADNGVGPPLTRVFTIHVLDASDSWYLIATESGPDTFVGAGTFVVTPPGMTTGALNVSETGPDTLVASGSTTGGRLGALNANENGSDTFAASGFTSSRTGALVVTEGGPDTIAAAGIVRRVGALVVSEGGSDTLAASGLFMNGTPYGDEEFFTSGSYIAYCSPWSIFSPPQDAFVQGVDYEDSIEVFPAFPDNSVINWRWPTPAYSTTGVYGYMAISYGNYDGGTPAVPVTPWQVGNIDTFVQTCAYYFTAGDVDAGILNELYLTTNSGMHNEKEYEIAMFLHTTAHTRSFVLGGAYVGARTDALGRNWVCYDVGLGGNGANYIIFMEATGADVQGTIDWKAALDWLVAQGKIRESLWVNGIAFGVEPDRGAGRLVITDYGISSFTGSGSVIPGPATNLLANPNFTSDASWIGFYFNGKFPDSTLSAARFKDDDPAWIGQVQPYDGLSQPVAFVGGKYYEVTFTITRTAGGIVPRMTGATEQRWTVRSASGTYTERLLATSGNNVMRFDPHDAGFQGTLDTVILTGPHDTSTVGGA